MVTRCGSCKSSPRTSFRATSSVCKRLGAEQSDTGRDLARCERIQPIAASRAAPNKVPDRSAKNAPRNRPVDGVYVRDATFAERMFRVVFLSKLNESDSRDAITKPMSAGAVHMTEDM